MIHKIEELVQIIRDCKQAVADVKTEVEPTRKAAERELVAALQEYGDNYDDGAGGYARLVDEGVRVSYNAKALDAVIASDEEKFGFLRDFRKESKVRGGLRVK
jgi:hypothetical protein